MVDIFRFEDGERSVYGDWSSCELDDRDKPNPISMRDVLAIFGQIFAEECARNRVR
ncbi:hypothetical protein FHX16_005525 [Rhizobium sp. BK661]|nr:hypothetical protein [Rhizobium sp. BK661]